MANLVMVGWGSCLKNCVKFEKLMFPGISGIPDYICKGGMYVLVGTGLKSVESLAWALELAKDSA
ncbi:predicted protein [Sclerotinia sclerotiorum 1980 UF-70]|uniref:Uncharacterized protein n=1 Tax=Sclerotinia sclerotiorum (strain ATCC 18683 / 1980 / Ss-1) TaxID=665079 RepID=A7EGT7_SCLS1|nr:predicted protein [Sclerotinia sclerotiorum 1980 UF-70]EDO02053.1 predicted protein [Sclerotinia sclerotiorum 1980 UF-70]